MHSNRAADTLRLALSREPTVPAVCPLCGSQASAVVDEDRATFTSCESCDRIYVTHWGRRSPSIELPLREGSWAAAPERG